MKAFFHRLSPDAPINYNLNIFLVLFGRLVSGFGSSIFYFVLGLYILDLTGSASKFSLTLAASLLPGFFVNLFGGVFVDRHSKKLIIVTTDVLSGISIFFYMLLFGFFSKNALLFILYPIVISVLQNFFSLALNTSVPEFASDEKVAKTNSGAQAINSMTNMIGPVVGALVYKFMSMYDIFIFYGSMLILSGLSESFLRFRRAGAQADAAEAVSAGLAAAGCAEEGGDSGPAGLMPAEEARKETAAAQEGSQSYFAGITEAVRYIFSQKILVFFFIFSSVMNMVYYPLMSMVMPFINYHVLRVSGLQLSVVQSAGAAGVIIGALLITSAKSMNGFLRRFFVFFMVEGSLILLWAFPRLPWFSGGKWSVVSGFALLLVLSSAVNIFETVPMVTYFQVKVPEALRGRVLGVFSITFSISAPVGLWLFGIAMGGLDWVIVTAFSGALILALGAIFSRNLIFREFIQNLE